MYQVYDLGKKIERVVTIFTQQQTTKPIKKQLSGGNWNLLENLNEGKWMNFLKNKQKLNKIKMHKHIEFHCVY